tara:strand:- start:748 stop:1101 length:354 start_codon:yes stop_codon:yes gene_type:complete
MRRAIITTATIGLLALAGCAHTNKTPVVPQDPCKCYDLEGVDTSIDNMLERGFLPLAIMDLVRGEEGNCLRGYPVQFVGPSRYADHSVYVHCESGVELHVDNNTGDIHKAHRPRPVE